MEALESRSQKSQQSKHGHLIQDYDERSSSSNSLTSDDENWYPGDGICPPEDQFQACRQASLHSWSQAASRSDGASKPLDMHLQAFLSLLKHFPDFFHQPPENVALTGGKKSPLVLRSSLHIQTTDSPHCCQQWKPIDYLQCLGFPKPSVYKTIEEPVCSVTLATQELRPTYLTNIILAWSYILSSRWVEIMQSAGKDCAFLHTSGDSMTENFWEVVTQGRWIARVKRGQANSYSPWMLQGEAESHKKSYEWVRLLPNSSVAFHILLDFCISDGLEREMLVGFAVILLLPSRNIPSPKLPPPLMISRPPNHSETDPTAFHEVFRTIDKWMTLSAIQDALDSLLCSAFFDPTIPCNLVGSESLGIRQALFSSAKQDYQKLLDAISWKTPHLSILWYSLTIIGQASPLLNMSLKGLPPICLSCFCHLDKYNPNISTSGVPPLLYDQDINFPSERVPNVFLLPTRGPDTVERCPPLLGVRRKKTSVLRFPFTMNTNIYLCHGRISGFYVQAKRFRRAKITRLNQVSFRLRNLLILVDFTTQISNRNAKNTRMQATNPAARRLASSTGIEITTMAFGLKMGL